jgi:hypothetical protein
MSIISQKCKCDLERNFPKCCISYYSEEGITNFWHTEQNPLGLLDFWALPISESNNNTACCKWACYHPQISGWGTRKRRKDHSLTRSAIHNCKYSDTQITVKKWRLASLHKFNYIQETWVLHSGKLCSPSSYLHHINILPNNSNSTVLRITKLCTMPVYVTGVQRVVFCNPVINFGRNHLRPTLIFVNIFIVLLFKSKRKFW